VPKACSTRNRLGCGDWGRAHVEPVAQLSFSRFRCGGKILMPCARTREECPLELGGQAPFIGFDEADRDAAVEGAIASKYRNQNRSPTGVLCPTVPRPQDRWDDAFAAKLAAQSPTRRRMG